MKSHKIYQRMTKRRRDGVIQRYRKRNDVIRVFVYGTLKKGFGNHRYLESSKFLGRVQVRGNMYSLGGFPVVVLTGKGTVHGEIYEVSKETLANLDRLEGYPSFYNRKQVVTSNGMLAWVYHMSNEKVKDHYPNSPPVKGGDWTWSWDKWY